MYPNLNCAKYPRHLGRQIRRCLIAIPNASIEEIAQWAYGEIWPHYALWNIRRHCRVYGIKLDES
jgi:hypothetical protein